MLGLFNRSQPSPGTKFLGRRVGYAVGDIHGCNLLLEAMLDELESRARADTREGGPPIVVFLGDYVDRGRESAAVIDLLLSGRPAGFERRYLKGNHEEAMLAFMESPMSNRSWLLQGGTETLMSYGVQPPPVVGGGGMDQDWIAASQALRERVAGRHLDFLQALERYVVLGDYLFVHAGVNDKRPLESQTDQDLFWSRAAFIGSDRRFSHRIVHGHTPVDKPFADHRRIAIDTGAYASGVLTAVRLEGEEVSFLPVMRCEQRPIPLFGERAPVVERAPPVTAADVDWG